jgi:hypothetical protein
MALNVGLPLGGMPVFRMKSARRQAPALHSLPDPASLFVSTSSGFFLLSQPRAFDYPSSCNEFF